MEEVEKEGGGGGEDATGKILCEISSSNRLQAQT